MVLLNAGILSGNLSIMDLFFFDKLYLNRFGLVMIFNIYHLFNVMVHFQLIRHI